MRLCCLAVMTEKSLFYTEQPNDSNESLALALKPGGAIAYLVDGSLAISELHEVV